MDWQRRHMAVGVAVLAVTGASWAAWVRFHPRPLPVPMTQPTILYSWTDAHGVVHFSQQSGQGQPIVVDPSHILNLPAPRSHRNLLDRHLLDRHLLAAGQDKPASGPDTTGGEAPSGGNIHQVMVERAVEGDNAPPPSSP